MLPCEDRISGSCWFADPLVFNRTFGGRESNHTGLLPRPLNPLRATDASLLDEAEAAPFRRLARAGRDFSLFNSGGTAAQADGAKGKIGDHLKRLLRSLEVREMADSREFEVPRAWNQLGQPPPVGHVDHPVLVPVDYRGRYGDSGQPLGVSPPVHRP